METFLVPRPPFQRHNRSRLLHNSIKSQFVFTFSSFFILHAIAFSVVRLLLQIFFKTIILCFFVNRWTFFISLCTVKLCKKISRQINLCIAAFFLRCYFDELAIEPQRGENSSSDAVNCDLSSSQWCWGSIWLSWLHIRRRYEKKIVHI